jgi:excisionase family DNA binding protein
LSGGKKMKTKTKTEKFHETSSSEENPITSEEACKVLSISKSTLFKWTSTGKVPHYKKFNRLYFLRSELRDWLLETKIEPDSYFEQQAIDYVNRNPRKF